MLIHIHVDDMLVAYNTNSERAKEVLEELKRNYIYPVG